MSEDDFLPSDLIGSIIDGRFELLSKLGEGGMGAIYKARQLSMERMVALKILLRDRRGDPISVERFRHEAYLASRLRHPNAVVIYDFGQSADGLLYIAMELLNGENLKERIGRAGTLDPLSAIKIMQQMLRPIAQGHRMGMIHRDLKPANIFLTEVEGDPDYVKVLDFGVAKFTAVQEGLGGYQGGLTVTGTVYGTPNYMSPEQIRGKDVDQQSDLYSLGIMLYELLCGRRPFEAETPVDVMMMHLRDEPPPVTRFNPSLPGGIDEILEKALSKVPTDRYESCEELYATLSAFKSQHWSTPTGGQMDAIPESFNLGSGPHRSAPVRTVVEADDDDDLIGDDLEEEKTILEVVDFDQVEELGVGDSLSLSEMTGGSGFGTLAPTELEDVSQAPVSAPTSLPDLRLPSEKPAQVQPEPPRPSKPISPFGSALTPPRSNTSGPPPTPSIRRTAVGLPVSRLPAPPMKNAASASSSAERPVARDGSEQKITARLKEASGEQPAGRAGGPAVEPGAFGVPGGDSVFQIPDAGAHVSSARRDGAGGLWKKVLYGIIAVALGAGVVVAAGGLLSSGPPPAPLEMTVGSAGATVEVFQGGRFLGETPLVVPIEPERKVEGVEFVDGQRRFTANLPAGSGALWLHVRLPAEEKSGTLATARLVSVPTNLVVKAGDEVLGSTPLIFIGPKNLELETSVKLADGTEKKLLLQPIEGGRDYEIGKTQ